MPRFGANRGKICLLGYAIAHLKTCLDVLLLIFGVTDEVCRGTPRLGVTRFG